MDFAIRALEMLIGTRFLYLQIEFCGGHDPTLGAAHPARNAKDGATS
jgi:hypothetical protein